MEKHQHIYLLYFLNEPSRLLRSSNSKFLCAPPSNKKYMGDRAFSVAGPNLWNNLPSEIRDCTDIDAFKKLLKTHLFNDYFKKLII